MDDTFLVSAKKAGFFIFDVRFYFLFIRFRYGLDERFYFIPFDIENKDIGADTAFPFVFTIGTFLPVRFQSKQFANQPIQFKTSLLKAALHDYHLPSRPL